MRIFKKIVSVLLSMSIIIGLSTTALANDFDTTVDNDNEMVVSNQLIIVTDDVDEISDLVDKSTDDIVIDEVSTQESDMIVIETTAELSEKISEYENNPEVLYVQPNFVYEAMEGMPNDEYANQQWILSNDYVNLIEAWDLVDSQEKVRVAILDSGITISHNDLFDNYDKEFSYDVAKDEVLISDSMGHGTMIAGFLGATTNNEIGIAGVAANNAELLCYNIYTETENADGSITYSATTSTIYKAFKRAVDSGARVINLSFGGYGIGDELLSDAINNANANGIVCIASGGNGTGPSKTTPVYPADYSTCISVTASNDENQFVSGYDFNEYKDIAAPGYMVMTTRNNGHYGVNNGTSFSAAFIAGVASLMIAANSELSTDQIKEILYSTAHDTGDIGRDNYYGWGIVDAKAAVETAIATVGDLNNEKKMSTFDITTSSKELKEGESTTVISAFLPEDTTDSKLLTYKTDDSEIAIVDINGVITAKAEGTVTITATTISDITATCVVDEVSAEEEEPVIEITDIEITDSNIDLIIGTSKTLYAKVIPDNTTMDTQITWSSENEQVATVDQSGVVTAVGEGETNVTAVTSNGISRTCKVTILEPITEPIETPINSVTLDKRVISLSTNGSGSAKLNAIINPTDTTQSKELVWTASNSKVAVVDQDGNVVAKGTGTATITVTTVNGKTATCVVTVTTPVISRIVNVVLGIVAFLRGLW
ncbi:MAG: S8 family serine peptidase [Suipraeoptans sp.]